jgi:hypothetical protein
MMESFTSLVGSALRVIGQLALDALFVATGRRLLRLFGFRPHDLVAMLAGLTIWVLVVAFVIAAFQT